MTARRTAPKRDANEFEIVDALRSAKCLVQRMSESGVPDLLVWSPWLMRLVLIEVKLPKENLNKNQIEWHKEWIDVQPVVVHSIEEALQAVGYEEKTMGIIRGDVVESTDVLTPDDKDEEKKAKEKAEEEKSKAEEKK